MKISTPDTVSFDSMISLSTPDETMASHRVGFTLLNCAGGVLHSVHTPFANDTETTVETWIKPLSGMHVRAHKVRLSRPYRIREGGFIVPRRDDYCPSACTADSASVENDKYVSRLQVLSDCPVKTKIFSPQAGYHLYAPLASYPAWETDVLEAMRRLAPFSGTIRRIRKKYTKTINQNVG